LRVVVLVSEIPGGREIDPSTALFHFGGSRGIEFHGAPFSGDFDEHSKSQVVAG
jgi:hypothetical protein